MVRRITAMAATALCAIPALLSAQIAVQNSTMETAITFTVPVNLTQLSPDLERVRLLCMINPSQELAYPQAFMQPLSQDPSQWPFKDELWVVSGKVVATMRIIYPLATEWFNNPIGKTASYTCAITGFSRSLQRWDAFDENSTVPAFRLKPTPPAINGTFVW